MEISKQIEIRNNRIQAHNAMWKLLDKSYRLTESDPRINVHNKLQHELAKTKAIYLLKKQGKKVFGEAITNKGDRFDIFIPEEETVIEILYSESDKMFKEKKQKYLDSYPDIGFVIGLKAEDVLKEDFVI